MESAGGIYPQERRGTATATEFAGSHPPSSLSDLTIKLA
jgi:hypothetical protein